MDEIDIEICPICGQEVDGGEPGVEATENMNFCDECQRHVCTDCYDSIDRMCYDCVAEKEQA